jgi:hypothetical protein
MFDVEAARKDGYNDKEIATYLASQNNMDIEGALKDGYNYADIINHYSPPKPAQEIGWARELGRGIVRSGAGVGEMAGNILRTVGAEETGEGLVEASRGLREEYAPGKQYQESFLGRGIVEGVEGMAPSLAAGIPGAIIGQAAIPIPILGSVIGYALGAGSAFAINEYHNYLDEYRKTFGDEPMAETKARAALSGLVEGGFEAVADALGGKYLLAPMMKTGTLTIKELLKTPIKEAAITFAKTAGIETGTEVTQNALEAWLRQIEELPTDTPLEAAKESIIPALMMTALFNLGHAGIQRTKIATVQKTLADPKAPEEDRLKAISYIDTLIKERLPEENSEAVSKLWEQYAISKAITDNVDANGTIMAPSPEWKPQPIDLNFMLDPLGAQATLMESQLNKKLFGEDTTTNPELIDPDIEGEGYKNQFISLPQTIGTQMDDFITTIESQYKKPTEEVYQGTGKLIGENVANQEELRLQQDKIARESRVTPYEGEGQRVLVAQALEKEREKALFDEEYAKLQELKAKPTFQWTAEDKAFFERMSQALIGQTEEKKSSAIIKPYKKNITTMKDLQAAIEKKKGRKAAEQPVVEAEAIPEETLAPESAVIPIEEEKGVGEQGKEKEPWEMTVQRIEEKGITSSVDKPQGLYTSPADIKSPHEYLGGEKKTFQTNPDANVLNVGETGFFKTNRGNVGESAGVATARRFFGDKEVSRTMQLSKKELVAELKEKYPDVEWNKYYDQQEMVEGLAGIEARKRGYDAIFALDEDPKFNEYVGLTDKAFKSVDSAIIPAEPAKNKQPELRGEEPLIAATEEETKATQEPTLETYSKGGGTKKVTVEKPKKVTEKPVEKPQKNIATKVLESAQEVVTGEREVPLSPYQEKVLAINPKNIDMSAKGIKKLVDDFYRRYFFAQDPVVRYVREHVGAEEADNVANKIRYIAGRTYVVKEMLEGKGVLTYGLSGEEETKYVEGSKSLMNILKPINSKIMYIDYESWRTARTFDALDRFRPDYKMPEGLADESRTEIARIEAKYGEEGMTVFRQIDKEHRQFEIDAILRPLRDVGWLSQEAFDRILSAPEAQYYSSLQREMEDIDKQGFGGQEVIKRRTGTEEEFKVIMSTESTIANLAKAVKLVATQKLNKDMVKLPELYPDLAEDIYEVPPEWRKVPHVAKAEIDPKMREQLTNMVTKLGGTVETLINIGKNKMGMFEYGLSDLGEETVNRIKLKFATSEQTFSHELGHMLDKKYSLIDKFITGNATYPEIKRELRKIADQRASEDSSEHFKKYVRSRPEQIAEFVSRYLTQPDQARQLAPNAVKKLEALFHTHPELKELMDIKPSGQSALTSMSDPAWMRMPYPPKGTITVAKNGAKHYYKVPEDVRKALDYYTPHEIHSIVQILSIPAKVLRAGATLTFDFMLRNPVRDQFTAAIYAKYGYIPFWDFGKGIYHIFKKDEIFHEWQASGAGEAFLFSMDRLGVNEKARDLLTYRGRGLKTYNPLEALRYFSGIMEMGTRVGVYGKARAKGATTQEAASEARESTVDFNRLGAEGRAINMMIAFWNANLQGMDIMRRKLFDKRTAGKTMLKIALGITLPSMILWAFNHDDERYKELPSWQKDLFWIINIGKDKPLIRIPKPFELGILFGSLPERLLSFAFDKDVKGMKEVAKSIGAGAIPGVLPTVAAPILENVTNYNFFTGRPLENQTLQGLPKPMRFMYGTTEISKKLGELTNVSPIKLDNMIQGWTGGLGRQFAELADYVLSDKVPEVEKKWYEQAAGVRGFVAREPIGPPSDSVNTFYDIYERTQQADRGFKTLTKAGQSADAKHFFSENKKDIAMASSARKISETLSELRKRVLMVQNNPSIASGTKRMRIDMIYKRMTDVAKTYNKLYNTRK